MRKIKMDKTIYKNVSSISKASISEFNKETDVDLYIIDLAERLINNQVTLMIGSGFSKNANSVGSKPELPSWVDLGEPFYKKLNGGKSPPYKITDVSTVQELAALIEKRYERTDLDEIIRKEIPDSEFEPSFLHYRLFEFPWRDVYTTNYDTLLERAATKNYKVINKQDELRLSKNPRIIKLHGGFPSNTPFIITKKDFDDYPKKYDIFVTNVKTALVETKFCLIGFSGEDPNFLSWINWLKKVLNPQYLATIYFFSINISEDERKSLLKNNIQAIDISFLDKKFNDKIKPVSTGVIIRPPTTDDYKAAYSKFFDKLYEYYNAKKEINIAETNAFSSSWPKKEHMYLDTEKDLLPQYKKAILNWEEDRVAYPGWIILSESRRKVLRNYTDTIFVHYLPKLESIIDIQFLYEFNWRLEKYLYPLYDDWAKVYKTTVEKYNPFPEIYINNRKKIIPKRGDKINWRKICIYWIELQLALLRYYRQSGKDKDWKVIAKRMEKIKRKLDIEQKSRYYYERCLFQLNSLNIQKVRYELSNWKACNRKPFWESKRASLIAELGDVSQALAIIKLSIKRIKKMIKLEKIINNYKLVSQLAYMLDLLDYIQKSVNHTKGNWIWDYKGYNEIITQMQELTKYECTPQNDIDYFDTLLKFDAPDYKQSVTGYKFELNEQYIYEQYGSDLFTLMTYSFINYMEEIGFPFSLPGITYGNNAIKQSIKRLQKFYFNLSLVTMIRARDEKSTENIFNRRIISNINNKDINTMFSYLLNVLKSSIKDINYEKIQSNKNLSVSIISILPTILGELSIKTNFSLRKELLKTLKFIYTSKNKYKYEKLSNCMKYLMESFSNTEYYEIINDLLDFPVLKDKLRYKLPDPFYYIDIDNIMITKRIKINISKINELINLLINNNEIREKAIIRLLILWKYQILTETQEKQFAVALWKITNDDGFPHGAADNYYYSAFLWFPHPKNINPQEIFKNYIANIKLPIQSIENDKSITMTYGNIKLFGNIIGLTNSKYNYKWSKKELHILINKIENWWNKDKIYLIKNDEKYTNSDSIKNEFKARFNNMLSIFACIFQPNINIIGEEYNTKINTIISELKNYGIPDIMARASYVKYSPSLLENTINDIRDGLFSKDEEIISDAIAGTKVLLRQKLKGMEGIIIDISQIIKQRTDIELYRFISIMKYIISDYPEYINNIILENIEYGFNKIITETVLDKESTDKETHTKQINRQYSVELASYIKKYYQSKKITIPDYIKAWEAIALDVNEVAEIRNAWA